MTSRRQNRAHVTVEGTTGNPVLPPRRRVRPIRLDTLSAVRTELAAVYRLARHGHISTSDLTRLAYTLRILSDLIRLEERERHEISDLDNWTGRGIASLLRDEE